MTVLQNVCVYCINLEMTSQQINSWLPNCGIIH